MSAVPKLHDDETITDAEFHAISRMVYSNFGILLGQEKRSLVIGRLSGTIARRGYSNFGDYVRALKKDMTGELLSELVNQISTNFTSFFREPSHFEFLADRALTDALRILQQKKSNDLRVWCAACSSGEEAYTIQMTIMRRLGLQYAQMDAGLLATDISAKVLDQAKLGQYTADQLTNIADDVRRSYFKHLVDGRYEVKPNVRDSILFRRFNLMNAKFPFTKPFHIIFCRNVMIYFDEETRRQLVRRFYDHLEPGGYLFIGHSETIPSEWTRFQNVLPAVYRK